MRAFWIVVFGLAGFATSVATSSASKVEYSEKELDDYCYNHAGVYKTDRENYWSCEIGSGKSTVHIDCNKAGKCTMWNEVVFTKRQPPRTNVIERSAAASTQISGGGITRPTTAAGRNSTVISSGSAITTSNATYSASKGATNSFGANKGLDGRTSGASATMASPIK